MDDDDDQPELRPLPDPPRCRGIPLGDGNYTGCAYGYGDLEPFTGPCDCPVCKGSGTETGRAWRYTWVPSSLKPDASITAYWVEIPEWTKPTQ